MDDDFEGSSSAGSDADSDEADEDGNDEQVKCTLVCRWGVKEGCIIKHTSALILIWVIRL